MVRLEKNLFKKKMEMSFARLDDFSIFTSKVDPPWTLPLFWLYYRHHSDVLLLRKQQYDKVHCL